MAETKSERQTFAAEAIPSDVKNGVFLGNPVMDNLVSCMIAMGTELWATKRRMKVIEAVMEKKGITQKMIEQYVPTETEKVAWEQDRDRFIDLTLGPLGDDGFRAPGSDFPKRG
ncbi:MAG: hypothetical protein JNM81_12665 [Rhodospirillaceae bacterium]|nr:hypothetical protein [Rhodospirillaceae bacterium]